MIPKERFPLTSGEGLNLLTCFEVGASESYSPPLSGIIQILLSKALILWGEGLIVSWTRKARCLCH